MRFFVFAIDSHGKQFRGFGLAALQKSNGLYLKTLHQGFTALGTLGISKILEGANSEDILALRKRSRLWKNSANVSFISKQIHHNFFPIYILKCVWYQFLAIKLLKYETNLFLSKSRFWSIYYYLFIC